MVSFKDRDLCHSLVKSIEPTTGMTEGAAESLVAIIVLEQILHNIYWLVHAYWMSKRRSPMIHQVALHYFVIRMNLNLKKAFSVLRAIQALSVSKFNLRN